MNGGGYMTEDRGHKLNTKDDFDDSDLEGTLAIHVIGLGYVVWNHEAWQEWSWCIINASVPGH